MPGEGTGAYEDSDMAFQATVGETQIEWRDTKRYLWIMGAIVPLVPVATVGLVTWSGQAIFWFFGPFFVFVVIPLFDMVAGLDRNNPPDEVLEALENDKYYRWVTYLFIPMQIAVMIFGSTSLAVVRRSASTR